MVAKIEIGAFHLPQKYWKHVREEWAPELLAFVKFGVAGLDGLQKSIRNCTKCDSKLYRQDRAMIPY